MVGMAPQIQVMVDHRTGSMVTSVQTSAMSDTSMSRTSLWHVVGSPPVGQLSVWSGWNSRPHTQ